MNLKQLGTNKMEIDLGEGKKVLVSYSTPVAYTENTPEGRMFYRTELRHSSTTERHINSWLPKDQAIMEPQDFFDKLLDPKKKFNL